MDFLVFNEYIRKQLEKEAVNDKEMKTDERLFKIEQRLEASVARNELIEGLQGKVDHERIQKLEASIQRVKQSSLEALENQDRVFKSLDAEMAKKTADLNSMILEMQGRLKIVEEEIAEDEDGVVGKSGELDATIRGGGSSIE